MGKTRKPHETFEMTIRRPVTGELAFTDAHDRSSFRVHVDVRDLNIAVETGADGQQHLQLSVPEAMRLRAGPEAMRRIESRLEGTLQEMGILRTRLTPEEQTRLDAEECAAAALDKAAEAADDECVVCRDSER